MKMLVYYDHLHGDLSLVIWKLIIPTFSLKSLGACYHLIAVCICSLVPALLSVCPISLSVHEA